MFGRLPGTYERNLLVRGPAPPLAGKSPAGRGFSTQALILLMGMVMSTLGDNKKSWHE